MMLRPAADSEPNPNNSKTHVWAGGGGPHHTPYPSSPLSWRLPHLCCPLVAAASTPTHSKGTAAASLPQSQVPTPVQDGAKIGPRE